MEERPKTPLEIERERLKEMYKADFRKRKEFLDEMARRRPLNSVEKALDKILELNDDTEEWINKLNAKTALNEAKAEIAIEERGGITPNVASSPSPVEAPLPPAVLPVDLKPGRKTLGEEAQEPEPPAAPRKTLDV
jgi:predicted metal-dependent phosphoesterase TrpH